MCAAPEQRRKKQYFENTPLKSKCQKAVCGKESQRQTLNGIEHWEPERKQSPLLSIDVREQHMQAKPNGQVQENTDHGGIDRFECTAQPRLV